jgi:hypothetical protein
VVERSGNDLQGEQQLLDLANHARAQAGVAPLRMEESLAQAAREHSSLMAERNQLSHDLPGEPALPQRLAVASTLHLSGEGENVAYAQSVSSAHNGFMASPHHRENLLDPDFNVVGFGIVRSGSMVYVTQDFGHSLPISSAAKAEEFVANSVVDSRARAGQAPFEEREDPAASSAACAMAQADALKVSAPPARYTVRYTTMQPEKLPDESRKPIGDAALRSFSVGACFKRTQSYPQGAYWVILLFY